MWPDDDEVLRRIFDDSTTWAVVGCSGDPSRDSHRIGAYLQELGYQVVPVNPNERKVLGEPCHPNLAAAVEALGPIAERLGLSRAQLSLAWAVEQPGVTGVICGTTSSERARENAASGSRELSRQDLADIDALTRR